MSGDIPDRQEEYSPEIDADITEPPDYKVLLHNDDYTTKAFVVEILMVVFNKSLKIFRYRFSESNRTSSFYRTRRIYVDLTLLP